MIELKLRLPRAGFVLDVDLQLPGAGISVLFGPSGCGKTSVLRAMAGLERAAGRVALTTAHGQSVWQDDGRGVFMPTHQRPLGYVIQEAALFPHLNVRANLAYGLRRSRPATPGGDGAKPGTGIALDQVVDLLGIGHLMDRRPDTLSGGERQRVAIARALATSPQVLLMDEPLAALDAARKAEVLPYLERLPTELGMPLVYVSHSIDEVARLADHLVLMAEGRVSAAGPLAELMARLDLPTTRGEGAGVVHDALVAERDAQWQLARLAVGPAGSGFDVWSRDHGLPVGQTTRVRLLARDVSLSRQRQSGSSIGNQLPGTVETLADDEHPGLTLVRVRVCGLPVLARLTRRSAHALALAPGEAVFVQIKSVALMA